MIDVKEFESIVIHNGNEHLLNVCGLNNNILEVYKNVLYYDGEEYEIENDKLYLYIEKKDSDYIITVNDLKLICPINDINYDKNIQ